MYECHITIEATGEYMQQKAQELIEKRGWKFSKIDGDPVLGKGVKCYATNHFAAKKNVDEVIRNMSYLAEELFAASFLVIREKVELIIFDTKRAIY